MQKNPFDKIEDICDFFKKETLCKQGIEWNFLNLVKDICEKPTAILVPNGERLNIFLLG